MSKAKEKAEGREQRAVTEGDHAEIAEPQRETDQHPPAPSPNGNTPGQRQDEAPPECPYHHVACKANRSEPFFTRYYCPIDGCTYSSKQPRPLMRRRLDFSRRGNPFDARAE